MGFDGCPTGVKHSAIIFEIFSIILFSNAFFNVFESQWLQKF